MFDLKILSSACPAIYIHVVEYPGVNCYVSFGVICFCLLLVCELTKGCVMIILVPSMGAWYVMSIQWRKKERLKSKRLQSERDHSTVYSKKKKSQIKFINNTEQMWKINYINWYRNEEDECKT